MPQSGKITVIGYEIVQSIQDTSNNIELFAEKPTLCRVYVASEMVSQDYSADAVLAVRRGMCETRVKSDSNVLIKTGGQHTLLEQRLDNRHSFNFILNEDLLFEGECDIQLLEINPLHPAWAAPDVEAAPCRFSLKPKLHLRVRAIGFRVFNPSTNATEEPDSAEFERFESWINRAFPCSKAEFCSCIVEAPVGFEPPYADPEGIKLAPAGHKKDLTWQKQHDWACAFLMAHRALDIEHRNVDPRTYYYGIIAHHGTPIVGAASNVSTLARPDLVGVGPAIGDNGELSAHELGHGLGCLHPGFPDHLQGREDPCFPFAFGKISDAAHGHMAWDSGLNGKDVKILDYDSTHDFMTYLHDPSWVSAYHYNKLIRKLRETEELTTLSEPSRRLHVAGTYSYADKKQSRIRHVNSVTSKLLPEAVLGDRLKLVARNRRRKIISETPIEEKWEVASDLHQDSGPFQVAIEYEPDTIDCLELYVDGKRVNVWPQISKAAK